MLLKYIVYHFYMNVLALLKPEMAPPDFLKV